MDPKPSTNSPIRSSLAGILAAVIAVRGTISIIPDFILRDRYGDIEGVFVIGLAVLAIVVFAAVAKAADGLIGVAPGEPPANATPPSQ